MNISVQAIGHYRGEEHIGDVAWHMAVESTYDERPRGAHISYTVHHDTARSRYPWSVVGIDKSFQLSHKASRAASDTHRHVILSMRSLSRHIMLLSLLPCYEDQLLTYCRPTISLPTSELKDAGLACVDWHQTPGKAGFLAKPSASDSANSTGLRTIPCKRLKDLGSSARRRV